MIPNELIPKETLEDSLIDIGLQDGFIGLFILVFIIIGFIYIYNKQY